MKELFSSPCCSNCKNQLFCSPNNPLHQVGDNLKNRKFFLFNTDEYLYRVGEIVKGIFCIYSGQVEIFKTGNLHQEIKTHYATNGEIIGLDFSPQGRHSFSAAATEETFACFIPVAEINQLMNTLSTITENMLYNKS